MSKLKYHYLRRIGLSDYKRFPFFKDWVNYRKQIIAAIEHDISTGFLGLYIDYDAFLKITPEDQAKFKLYLAKYLPQYD